MPIEVGIWKLGEKLKRLDDASLETEFHLEEQIIEDISILSPDLMLIGSQIPTAFGKFIDLLAVDAEGDLHIIELKRDRTPRDVIGQILDYASWVKDLSYEAIVQIYADKNHGKPLEEAFEESFGKAPDQLNQDQQLIVVATELDNSTERIINYLANKFNVPVNAVFFRCFQTGEDKFLARTWLIDPTEVETKASKAASRSGEVWNGKDFYVALGEGEHRNWQDCVNYGFISAGQGIIYSKALKQLFSGARIFVYIPGKGYTGVGVVKEESVRVTEFKVDVAGEEIPILDAPLDAPNMGENADDQELSEYVVKVEWIKTDPIENAYKEKGLFANQNIVCRLRNKFTLDRLKKHFEIDD